MGYWWVELKSEGEHEQNESGEQGEECDGSEDLGKVVTVHCAAPAFEIAARAMCSTSSMA